MFDVDTADVPAHWPELVRRLRAGESVRVLEKGQDLALIRGVPSDLGERLLELEATGRLTVPPNFGRPIDYDPIRALDGGFVGAVEAVIEERRSGH